MEMEMESWRHLGRVKREGDFSEWACKDGYGVHQVCLPFRYPALKLPSHEVMLTFSTLTKTSLFLFPKI